MSPTVLHIPNTRLLQIIWTLLVSFYWIEQSRSHTINDVSGPWVCALCTVYCITSPVTFKCLISPPCPFDLFLLDPYTCPMFDVCLGTTKFGLIQIWQGHLNVYSLSLSLTLPHYTHWFHSLVLVHGYALHTHTTCPLLLSFSLCVCLLFSLFFTLVIIIIITMFQVPCHKKRKKREEIT